MTRHWYRITIADGLATMDRYGTSDLGPEALVEHVMAGKFVMLSDFSYYHTGKKTIVPASTEDPSYGPTLYINPARIVMIHPLMADPRRGDTTAQ
jgi:hypothetical protein